MLTHLQMVRSSSESWLQNTGSERERDESSLKAIFNVCAVSDKLASKGC